MSISLSIDRNITVSDVIYEVSAYGDRVFNFKISALIEGSYKDDIEMIFMQCRDEKNVDLFEIESVLIRFQISYELYQIVCSKKYHDVLTIFIGTNNFRRYVYSFDDLSKKEEGMVDLCFEDWVEAARYIQDTITKNSNKTIPNKLNNPKIPQSFNAEISSLIIPQNQEVHIPRNTLSVKFISLNDKNVILELAFKQGDEYLKKNVVINAAYPLHIYEAIKSSKILPYVPKKIIIYVSSDSSISFLIDTSDLKCIVLYKNLMAVGSINVVKNIISPKLEVIFKDYSHIENHINDWIETYKEFFPDNTPVIDNKKFHACQIHAKLINNNIAKMEWDNLGEKYKYNIYRMDGKGRFVRLGSTSENYYNVSMQSPITYKYAVVAVLKEYTGKITLLDVDFKAYSLESLLTVQIGDVYCMNKILCGHYFWKVFSVTKNEISLRCVTCNKELFMSPNILALKGSFAYHSNNAVKTPMLPQSKSTKHITKADIIVLSTTKYCTYLNHTIDDYIGVLPIATEKSKTDIEVDLGYCRECNKYIMLTSTYLRIQGDPICMVKDMRTGKVYNKPDSGFWLNSTEHIIHQYGYNVKSGNGMLSTDRQEILAKIINNGGFYPKTKLFPILSIVSEWHPAEKLCSLLSANGSRILNLSANII